MKSRFVILVLLLAMLVPGCGPKESVPETPDPPAVSEPAPKPPTPPEQIAGTGRYVGQIDSNSVEIVLILASGEEEVHAFRLNETLRDTLPDMGLGKNQKVQFDYFLNGHGQFVLTAIEKM